MTSSFAAAAVAIALALSTLSTSDRPGGTDWGAQDDSIFGRLEAITYSETTPGTSHKTYVYSPVCFNPPAVRLSDGCVGGRIPEPRTPCETGAWLEPRWSRARLDDGTLGPWTLEAGYTCPGDDAFPLRLEEFRRLPLSPSPLNIQPPNGWVLAGLEAVAYSDDAPQGFLTTLLGLRFYVAAVPVSFSWDFGDGSAPITSETPGTPWPNHSVGHTYRNEGVARPRLTTSWKGYFRREGSTEWVEIAGTATTTTEGDPIVVHTARTRLVEDLLRR